MPEDVRRRLAEAAARSGRSLNAEIVHRLDRDLRRSSLRRAADAAVSLVCATSTDQEGRRRMSRRSLRRPALVAALLGLAITAALVAGGLRDSSSARAPVSARVVAELPPGVAQRVEAAPESGGARADSEGPAAMADAAFAERAYPDDTISVADVNAARSAFATISGRSFPKGKGQTGTWTSVGPSEALYPFTPFRNSFSYVPNRYVAGGRTTSIAISQTCKPGNCTAYITPAGGGVWRAKNVLTGQPNWQYLGGPLGINAAGSVYIDPNDPSGNTVYVGTGEANICGSGCVAGVGLYKSTDGGDSWSGPIGQQEFQGKGIGSIVVKPGDPNTIYVGSTTALRGMSSSCCSGVTRPVPGIAQWGLYKSTNGGANWSLIHNGGPDPSLCNAANRAAQFANAVPECSPRGVRQVALDPTNSNIVYASSYARGIWRSNNAGATWTQIKPSINAAIIQSRAAMAVTTLPNGKTRMYVHEGNNNNPTPSQTRPDPKSDPNSSRLFRSDDVATGSPVFTDMSSASPADPGYAFRGLCDPQCWYDIFVYTPKGHPDMVYVGGDYYYGETTANKRAVILSTDAGVSGTDMTFDGTDPLHPNGIHPDQHSLVTNPNNPFQFFETGDGGVIRSSGEFVDRSSWCDDPNRGLTGALLARCKQLLSRIPSELQGLNHGLSTLQFQSLSVSPHNVNVLQGGTQDNGTWESDGNPVKWENMMIGDGGQSGFDVAIPNFRFHTFTGPSVDVNFDKGDIGKWIWTGDPLFAAGNGVSEFYSPVISDPVVSKTMFAGTGSTAYRTKTAGLGNRTYAEAQAVCNEWFGTFAATCGDWARLGPTPLTDAALGTRAGGAVAAIERTTADSSSAWAATSTGRVFISKNVDADPASAVAWTRLDDDSSSAPNRYVSSIYVDPTNGNHAWISYSGYGANTPTTPGHVFEVTYDPGTGTSTWVDRSYDFGDLPVTDLVRDDVTGDLYAASDFGVARLASGTTHWTLAAPGMPNVEVPGLTIIPSARILYAATHGLSAWRLNLG
jgi:Arc-like DNA binding domain